MKNAILYAIIAMGLSFALNYFFFDSENLWLDLYFGFAFGLAWAMAYFLDRGDLSLPKKLGISFIGMMFLVIIGLVFFDLEKAISTILKYSMIFTAYYLIASFRANKTLRK